MSGNKRESEAEIKSRIIGIASSVVTKDNKTPAESAAQSKDKSINFAGIESIGERTKVRKISNRIILENGGNIERAIAIMAGLIACPNGGTTTMLNYDIPSSDEYSEQEAVAVLTEITRYLKDEVEFHNQVYGIIYRCLATDGADVELYLPNSIVAGLKDKLATTEAEKAYNSNAVNWVTKAGADKAPMLEDTITISDNPAILFKHLIAEESMRVGAVEADKKKNLDINQILKQRHVFRKKHTLDLSSSLPTESSGLLVKRLPPESVAPLHLNGPDEPAVRYVVLIDPATGHPIRIEDDLDFYKDFQTGKGDNKNSERFRMLGNTVGMKDFVSNNTTNSLDRVYNGFRDQIADGVSRALIENTYGQQYSIEQDDQIIDIMFHRLLKKQGVQVLVLNPENVSYIAAERNRFGIGESLISKTEALALMYITLFHAQFLANLDSSIPRKKVIATMSEYDTDQEKTLEQMLGEVANSQKSPMNFDVRAMGNRDLLDNLARHGMQVEIENISDTSDIPNFNLRFEDIKRNIETVEPDFLERINNQLVQKIKMSPEIVDNSNSPEFSSQVARDNDITKRQMSEYVSTFNGEFGDRGVKRVMNNQQLMMILKNKIGGDESTRDEKLFAMLSRFTATLPEEDSASMEEDLERIEKLSSALDAILDDVMPDWIPDALMDAEVEEIDSLRQVVKAGLMRDYIIRNNAFRGLIERITTGDIEATISNEFEIAGNLAKIIALNSEKLKAVSAGIVKRREIAEAKALAKAEKEQEKLNPEPVVTPEPAADPEPEPDPVVDNPEEDVIPEEDVVVDPPVEDEEDNIPNFEDPQV